MAHRSRFKVRAGILVAAATIAVAASAQADLPARIDAYIGGEMKRQTIPGVALAVVKDGQPVLVKGYGLANVEHQIPVKPETIFQSGSVGKQFTSALVMLLVEDGKLGLDDKISQHLGAVPTAWSNITVRHLLTHTAGLTDYPKGFDFRRDYTEDELLKRVQEVPLAFQPGERFQYSNLGYVTLGILIGKVGGKFYGDLLQERVFKPLGMSTARIISETEIVPNRAAGYSLLKGELRNQNWVSPTMNTTADGSLYLTLHDMIRWDAALTNGTLLKPASLDAITTPLTLNGGAKHPYGFGWAIANRNGRRLFEHGGAWQGFVAHISRYVDDKLTVIVFVNRSGVQAGSLANGVAAIVNPDLTVKPLEDTEPAITASHKKLLQDLIDGNVDKSLFTPEAAEKIVPAVERTRAEIKALGPIDGFEAIERAVKEGNRLHRYRVRFKNANALMTVVLNADGKITSLNLRPE
jgi:CubicO group peptidase (beta-lactamase class C family)